MIYDEQRPTESKFGSYINLAKSVEFENRGRISRYIIRVIVHVVLSLFRCTVNSKCSPETSRARRLIFTLNFIKHNVLIMQLTQLPQTFFIYSLYRYLFISVGNVDRRFKKE